MVEEFPDVVPVVRVLLGVEREVREPVSLVAVTKVFVVPSVHPLCEWEDRDIPVMLRDGVHQPIEATDEHLNPVSLGIFGAIPVDGSRVGNVNRRLNVFQQITDVVTLPRVDVYVGVCRGNDRNLPVL